MKIAFCAAALAFAAACGSTPTPSPGPLDRIRLPTGMVVQDHRVLVASSNSDLLYATDTGGTVISLDAGADPTGISSVGIAAALDVRSFAGELAIARPVERFAGMPDAASCGAAVPTALALFGTRGSNTLNVLSVAPSGALACKACGLSAGGGFGDPFSVAVACGGGRARAYFGYLSTPSAQQIVGELDLQSFTIRTLVAGLGQALGLAYDRDRDRLFLAGAALGTPTPLRWIDLAGCTFGAAPGAGGCTVGSVFLTTLPAGLELRSIALANPGTPGNPAPRSALDPIRAYAVARLYDPGTAASAGFRTTDFGGLLIVLDLFDDALGGVRPEVVWTVPIGSGAQDVRVLPPRGGGLADVVVAMTVEGGVLTIYDDETRSVASFRYDELTGAPVLGHQPFGLAVDPEPIGTVARIWIGSWADSFVTPIDVPLAAPDLAAFTRGAMPGPLKITGATP